MSDPFPPFGTAGNASVVDIPEAGGDSLAARARAASFSADGIETGAWEEGARLLLRVVADALEGARKREHRAAYDERAACIAELRRSEQAERKIGRHQRAEGFHGAANTLGNIRLAWDRAQGEDIRSAEADSEVGRRIAEAVAAEREACISITESVLRRCTANTVSERDVEQIRDSIRARAKKGE